MSHKKRHIPWNKGIAQSDEAKRKNSEAHKGRIPWNKGLTGYKIKPRSEESKRRTSEKMKGKRTRKIGYQHSEETKRKIGMSNKGKQTCLGRKHSEETKHRIGKANKINSTGKRFSEETKAKQSEAHRGKKSYLWKGGISFEPYCSKFSRQLKKEIRGRDNHTCQLCNEKENGRKLDIHHIHYDRENCKPHLIALCRKCHSKTNINRDYYEALFMSKLRERGLIE